MSVRNKKRMWGVTFIALAMIILAFMPVVVQAQRAFPPLIVNCDMELNDQTKQFDNPCGFDDFIQLFINLFDWGLAILSILSVIFFIIGGTLFLLSSGNETRITQGKAILANTMLGILVSLGSWLIINTVIGLLVGNGALKDVQVFGENWWGVPSCASEYSKQCTQYTLKQGCGDIKTSFVSQLQRKLNEAPGCERITVDGCFGPETNNALSAFNKAVFGDSVPGSTAGKGTWDALNEGKGCNVNVNTRTPATGTGCCVEKCYIQEGVYGIENTAQSNNTDGCQDLFPSALWYNGACTAIQSTDNNGQGCCVTLETSYSKGNCVQSSNKEWCTGAVASGGQGGTYFNDTCRRLVQCQPGTKGAPIDYSCEQQ